VDYHVPIGLVLLAASLAGTSPARPAQPYSAVLNVGRIETRADAGSRSTAVVEVRNTGTQTWVPNGAVRLSYHWLSTNGEMLMRDGERTTLARPVRPGETTHLCATFIVPAQPGRYQLAWDMVNEGVGWFADRGTSSQLRVPLVVSSPATSRRAVRPLAPLVFLFGVCVAHVLLTTAWLAMYRVTSLSADERFFAAVLLSLAVLQAALHLVACTVGLSLAAVALVLCACHIAAAAFIIRGRRAGVSLPVRSQAEDRPSSRAESVLQWAGILMISGIVAQWFITAVESMAVEGTDAAHYHVPNAVNFALGANPWNFTATPHLYPMGTSVLAGWFILPLRDPLLIELAMIPSFLLIGAALAVLFRLVTGASGLAWVPSMMLVVFATPMFQVSSLVSADLMYAAAFLALNTQLFKIWRDRGASGLDLTLAGAALGLLLGSKVTGVMSSAMLFGVYAVAAATWWSRPRATTERLRPRVSSILGAVCLAGLAGGIWPLRNWVNFGSPLAPSGLSVLHWQVFPGDSLEGGRYYLSILKDIRDLSNYHLMDRAAYFLSQWMGRWYVFSELMVILFAADALYARRSRYGFERLSLLAIVVTLTVPHVWFVVQAPWSSLEWSKGLALRYVLPFLILWAFIAFTALFSLAWPWWKQSRAVVIVGGAINAAAIAAFWHAHIPGMPTLKALPLMVILMAGLLAAGHVRKAMSAVTITTTFVMGACAVWLMASTAAAADLRLRPAEDFSTNPPLACVAESGDMADRYVAAYAKVLDFEQRSGVTCVARRFFITARFDLPMALQPTPYSNLVYDARPRTIVPRSMRMDGPGMESCDYVIASEAELQTDRGNLFVNQLRAERVLTEIGVSRPYVVFAASRRRVGER
jgi:hypothetical protein